MNSASLVAATKDEAVKTALKDATKEAERLGLCGAPSFLVGGDVSDGGLYDDVLLRR